MKLIFFLAETRAAVLTTTPEKSNQKGVSRDIQCIIARAVYVGLGGGDIPLLEATQFGWSNICLSAVWYSWQHTQ